MVCVKDSLQDVLEKFSPWWQIRGSFCAVMALEPQSWCDRRNEKTDKFSDSLRVHQHWTHNGNYLFLIHTTSKLHSITGRPQISSGQLQENNMPFWITKHGLWLLNRNGFISIKIIYDHYVQILTPCTCPSLMCHRVLLPLLSSMKAEFLHLAGRYHYQQRASRIISPVCQFILQGRKYHFTEELRGVNLALKSQHSLHEHKLLCHTDGTVQLFSRQYERSHAEHSQREKQDRTEQRRRRRVGKQNHEDRQRNGGWERCIMTTDSLLQFWLCIEAERTGIDKENKNWEKKFFVAGGGGSLSFQSLSAILMAFNTLRLGTEVM